MIALGSTVVASPDQVSSGLAGEAVVLNMKNGVYYGLDEVGARIWSLIQSPRRVEEVCAALLEEYDVVPEQLQRDLLELLEQLAGEGLVEVQDAAAA